MTARPPTPTDPRADAYRAALDAPPTADHVAALQALGLPVPATQIEASRILTAYIRGREVGR